MSKSFNTFFAGEYIKVIERRQDKNNETSWK